MARPNIDPDVGCIIPAKGEWPVDPQDDVAIEEDRLWIDGCFDFFHHGHAGVMLQARRLGSSLLVGLHSDADIAANKGPTVMNLAERTAAIDASRFSTLVVPHAPYVTSLAWIGHYGCQYVVHGDDVTSDASGEDCYRFVKRAERMKIVPRTPGISTTDLVGRMLMCSKEHFIKDFWEMLEGREGWGGQEERKERGVEMLRRVKEYAAAPNGQDPYVQVYSFTRKHQRRRSSVKASGATSSHHHSHRHKTGHGTFTPLTTGRPPRPDQRIVYTSGAFDLFSSGHIAFLATLTQLEATRARSNGWYTPEAISKRIEEAGEDYPPAYVIVGLEDDETVNERKGINYPIMNIFERGLCVVQCRYVHGVVFSAPASPTEDYLHNLPFVQQAGREVDAVCHGPSTRSASANVSGLPDPYAEVTDLGLYIETPEHDFQDVNAAQIVRRILDRRAEYEERQRKKGVKAVGEGAIRREEMEKERERKLKEVESQFGA